MKAKTIKSSVPLCLRGQSLSFRVPLYPYQKRWVLDGSRFKLAVKAAQIGYSFAAALEAVLDCIQRRALWIVLSRGERQSLEFMEKVREHAKALRIVGSKLQTTFFGKADLLQHEIKFPNGSRILGLPANPDTARGYTGNLILDEFAFHQADREIWAAAFGRISRGDLKLRVLSTPNGQRGKYYELAKEAGLTDNRSPLNPSRPHRNGEAPDREGAVAGFGEAERTQPVAYAPGSVDLVKRSAWSPHWCDVHTAVEQGCPIHVDELRAALGDEEIWQQEYECAFLSHADQYIPLDLILACQHPEATATLPAGWETRSKERECYLGYDVARVRDLAVVAVLEKVGDVLWTRALLEMPATTFAAQEKVLCDLIPFCARGAVDATGLGNDIAERLARNFPGKVEPVSFTAARKQEMAVRMKRHFEDRTLRIPDYRPLRRDLNAVKRIITTAGNIRFDAERTEEGHADRFWALALALHAAGSGARVAAVSAGGWEDERDSYVSHANGEWGVASRNTQSPSLTPHSLLPDEWRGSPWA